MITIVLVSVGVAGFEPTTSTSQMWRDTGLRYTPNFLFYPRLALESDANVVKIISDKHFYGNDSKKKYGKKIQDNFSYL